VPRDALFDAAVNKALSYARRLGVPLDDREKLRTGLELWYLKTRFAYRVPLDDVIEVLGSCPDALYAWKGGAAGRWLPPFSAKR
jgi:hypothetical protein